MHLGLDLGGTNIKTVVLSTADANAERLFEDIIPTQADDGPDAVASALAAAAESARDCCDVTTLGVPGHFDRGTGEVVLFPNLVGPWEGYPLRQRLEDATGLSAWMVNDARAFTLAEGTLGAGRGCQTLACFTLGTGVGGGIMIDGRLHRGAFGVAGELGHQTIVPDGPLCGCGNRGCVEALTKADALVALAGKSSADEVFAAAAAGETRSAEAVSTVAGYLALGLTNVVTILGPDRIVVGGGIADAGELLFEPLRKAVKERVTLVPTDGIDIVPAELGNFAGAVGAAVAGAIRP